MQIRLLNQEDIRLALSMNRAIELMTDAFAALSQGTIEVPVRTNIVSESGTMLYKPALLPSPG